MIDPGLQDSLERAALQYTCIAAPFLAGIAARGNPLLFALGVPAAILAAQPICDAGYPQPFPWTPPSIPFLGGQCPQIYRWSFRFRLRDGGGLSGEPIKNLYGPVKAYSLGIAPNAFGTPTWHSYYTDAVYPAGRVMSEVLNANVWEVDRETFGRLDGLPDNCGDLPYLPPSPPIQPPFPDPPNDPDGNPILPPWTPPPIPWTPPGAPRPIFLPITFPPVVIPIAPTFPISIPINLGGVKIGEINIGFNGDIKISFGAEKSENLDELKKLLEEIKECACEGGSAPSTQVVNVPYVADDNPCAIVTLPLEVVSGAYSTDKANKMSASAGLALLGCEGKLPEQEDEALLGTGITANPAVEQFVTGISPDVKSVRLSITGFSAGLVRSVSTFPAANQRLYGSMGFSLLPTGAAGDYIYVYDSETYLALPKRGKNGVIRLLLKPSVAWSLYDTGERY